MYNVCLFFPLVDGSECRATLCLCGRGERQPECLLGGVRAGVHGAALTAMEASAGPGGLGHTSHLRIHLHVQQPHRHALGPGTTPSK